MPGGLATLLLMLAGAAGRLEAQVRATVYPDGRVFVRRTINQPIAAGTTVLNLPADALAGSLVALDSGVTVVAAALPQGGDQSSLLRRSVGRRVVFRMTPSEDTVSALVLSADPPRYQLASGFVVQALPGMVLFPTEAAGGATVTLSARSPQPRVELGYMTNGASWIAQYTIRLGGRRATLGVAALILSETVTLDSAEISILEGDVSRVIPSSTARSPEERARLIRSASQAAVLPAWAAPFRLHRIPGRHSIRAGEVSTLSLMPVSGITVERVFRLPGILDARPQPVPFSGGAQSLTPIVRYLIPRTPGPLSGALPPGTARIYRPVGTEYAMVAEGEVLAADGDSGGWLEVVAGASSDIMATRTIHQGTPVQDTVVSSSGSRTVRAVATIFEHGVVLRNLTDTTQIAEIVERRTEGWSVLSSSVPAEPLGEGAMRFRIMLPARGMAVFRAQMRVPVE
jgi:hypothetical protein